MSTYEVLSVIIAFLALTVNIASYLKKKEIKKAAPINENGLI